MGKKQNLLQQMLSETKKIRKDNEGKQGGQFEKIDWFKAKVGDNPIRILPAKNPDKPFYKQVSIHFVPIKKKDGGTAKIPARCLQDFDEDCPMCLAYTRMAKSKDQDKKDQAQWLRPGAKFLVNIFNYTDRKVQPYAMPMTVFDGITGWMEEFQSDVSDLDEGRDFKVIQKNKSGRTEYEVRPSLKDSRVADKVRALVSDAVDLEKLYEENERERMIEYVESIGEWDGDEEPPSRPAKKKSKPMSDDEDEDPIAAVDEDDDEDEDDEEEEKPVAKAKAAKAKADAAKKKSKPKAEEEDDEDDFDVDLTDKDLDDEFAALDV